jgi:GntR family transcriptional repressor for pyruvate dehydrogenase complex
VADVVADELRDRILATEEPDGALLPKLDDLFDEFRVSLPSIREALRILETEGLVTVLRGNTGGAAIRRPSADRVAYMLALVLQSDDVGVDDVAGALRSLEPVCAAQAAERRDRAKAVVPVLRARLESSHAALDDADAYVHEARTFHEELVASCGNRTMIVMIGALESLWSAHVEGLVRKPAKLGAFADAATRKRSLADHRRLVAAIEKGDAKRAEQLARAHFSEPERHDFVAAGVRVQAALLRD